MALHDLIGRAESAVSALLCRKIDDDRAALQMRDDVFGHEDRRFFPWNERGRNDDVDLGRLLAKERHLGLDELRAHLFRVAQQYVEMPVPANGRRAAMDSELVPLSEVTLERLRQTLRPRQAEELDHLEQGLPFLATTGSVAPFVGLFGTVWGIMQSFHAIGQGSGATLAVVGPGIADALIATAVGLAAATPAVVAYNHFLNRLRRVDEEMESFIEELVQLFETYAPNAVPASRGSGSNRMPLTR